MLGTDREPGIYVRTLNDLFKAIEETSDDMQYNISMSYLEVRMHTVSMSASQMASNSLYSALHFKGSTLYGE